MLHYILQTIAFQLFFLIIYDLFLKKETFFNWNRVYLLVTVLLSVVLPFIKVEQFKDVVPQNFIVTLPEIVIGKLTQIESTIMFGTGVEQNSVFVFSWQLLFYLGALIALGIFVFKLIKIALLIYKNPKRWKGDLLIVKLINSNAAFSFFYYVFLGEHIKSTDRDTILKHEMIHVQQKHSIDLLVFEILRILFWFNPLVYMYQNRITTLHEYIADAKALKTQDKHSYYQNLLAQVFETQNVSFINSFFKQSLIKKRIVMIGKTKSKQILKLKYILLVPMVFGMLIYTSCTQEKDIEDQNNALDLSQYAYTLKKDEGGLMSKETKEIHNKYETFLKTNPNYVGWTEHTDEESRYTVHHRDEEVPENLEESSVNFPDGTSYVLYVNWPRKANSQSETETEEIPFILIENVPVYPGCENLSTNAERRKCMSDKITKFVQLKFNTDLAGDLGLTGRQRISVVFKINSEGVIEGIRSRAADPRLEKEAEKVISLLPEMIPGSHEGKNVVVPYSLPIIFQVEDGSRNSTIKTPAILEKLEIQDYSDASDLPFSVVENVPLLSGCENLSTNAERRTCMSDKITKYVQLKFNTDLAANLGLIGPQRIAVIFKIDASGNIVDIRARAAHKKLEEEAKRVIRSLPKMVPGNHKGKNVNVAYSLPIIFQIQS